MQSNYRDIRKKSGGDIDNENSKLFLNIFIFTFLTFELYNELSTVHLYCIDSFSEANNSLPLMNLVTNDVLM